MENNYFLNKLKIDFNPYRNEKSSFIMVILRAIFLKRKFKLKDLSDAWDQGADVGFEQGVHFCSPVRQQQELKESSCGCGTNGQCSLFVNDKPNEEFYDKFYSLCEEYNMKIEYHPNYGLRFTELNK